MTVEEGEIFGLLGPNGAGKTTLVRCVLGLSRASSGVVELFGSDPTDPRARKSVGFVPEIVHFPDFLSAPEVMRLHAKLIGFNDDGALSKLLEDAGLADEHKRVRDFSKGMLRRLALAQALIGLPRLMVLDEPTADLDPIGRRDVRTTLQTMKEHGTTVLLNSHLLSEVERVCDRVAIMHQGRLVATGPMDEMVPAGKTLEEVFVDLVEGAR